MPNLLLQGALRDSTLEDWGTAGESDSYIFVGSSGDLHNCRFPEVRFAGLRGSASREAVLGDAEPHHPLRDAELARRCGAIAAAHL